MVQKKKKINDSTTLVGYCLVYLRLNLKQCYGIVCLLAKRGRKPCTLTSSNGMFLTFSNMQM